MISNIYKSFVLAFAFVSFLSNAKAQFIWKETHPSNDQQFSYSFTAVSCSGDNCTVAGITFDKVKHHVHIMFWRSNDGGLTWSIQDPGLPYELGQNQNQFISIQQIDSLNVVAVGDTGLLVRTYDGGKTWETQNLHTKAFFTDVDFSDPMTGIVTAYDTIGTIFVTSDGGKNWKTIQIGGSYLRQCHSYGNGKFRVFKEGLGPLYTTNNNWETIDSTKLLIDSTRDTNYASYFFDHCNFTGGDTIIAYGNYLLQSDGLLMRSIDAGAS